MNKKMPGPFSLYAILGLIFIALIGLRTISTPEIWTHLAQGRANEPISFLSYDNQINPTHLYDTVAYGLWSVGGAPALILFNIICMVAAFALLVKASEKWGGGVSQGFALLLCGWLIFRSVDVGPQSAMMLFIALFIYLFETQRRPAVLFGALIPLQLLWTNMHGTFLFGPLIAALALLQDASAKGTRKRRQGPSFGLMAGLIVALLLCTLANPAFIKLHAQIFRNIAQPLPIYWSSLLYDFFPVSSQNPLVFFAMILGAGGLITLKKRLPIMLTSLAVIGTVLVVRSSQTAALLFAVLAFPFLVLSFTAVGEAISASMNALGQAGKKLPIATRYVLALLLVLSWFPLAGNRAYANTGSASNFGFGYESGLWPSGADAIINHAAFPAPERTLNLAADGGYLAFHHDRKIFIDYRPGRYPSTLIEDISRMLRGDGAAYTRIQEAHRPEAMILNTLYTSVPQGVANLLATRRWRMVYFDGSTAILVQNLEKFAPLFDQVEAQQKGLQKLQTAQTRFNERLKNRVHLAGNCPEVIGAAQVYLALNRPTESKALFTMLLQHHNDVPASWIGLGRSQLMLKEYEAAVESLRKALDLSPDSLPAWSSYATACRRTGLDEEQAKAEEKIKDLVAKNKAMEDAAQEKIKKQALATEPAAKETTSTNLPAIPVP